MSSSDSVVTLEKLVSLCKRRGFVYQSSEIYGGLNGVYDFGPIGYLLNQSICNAWTRSITTHHNKIVFLDGAVLGSEAIWNASGHINQFHDPMTDCLSCKKRYRTDDISLSKNCPHCGVQNWSKSRQFNMMFKTQMGAVADQNSYAYLRPETAQSIFVNFKNVVSTSRLKPPFGIAQIGKAFRNEITPKQFLFRMREFQQMELEWFCKESEVSSYFDLFTKERFDFYESIGINAKKVRIQIHKDDELAHYSLQCNDIEYEFPFGWREVEGIANRGNFDLTNHSNFSGKDLSVHDPQEGSSYIPHVIECSVGIDRLFLTLLFDAYCEDTVNNEERIVLKFSPVIAPIKAAFLPLTKKQSLETMRIFSRIKQEAHCIPTQNLQYDETGSIGKRYRRQDEIGTPFCFTYDFESTNDACMTIRNRDTTEQKRISFDQIGNYLRDHILPGPLTHT